MNKIIAALLFLALSLTALSQPVHSCQGYQRTIGGFRFQYHSPLSDNSPALLSRAQETFEPVEWETEVVPAGFNGKEITFMWAYGMDVNPESHSFDVYVNNRKLFTIHNPVNNQMRQWEVNAGNGARLMFHVTRVDKYNDQMGFASLTLPAALVIPGKAVRIKVDGEKSHSDAWYMTFAERLVEELSIGQKALVAKEEGRLYHVIGVDFLNTGPEVNGTIKVGDDQTLITAYPGTNSWEIRVPRVEQETIIPVTFHLESGDPITRNMVVKPVRQWTVFMVQHTHTDIGYTRPQTEIMPEHLRFIDYALDYCDLTDDYPEEAQFRWTCEASWPVQQYLRSRPPSQIDRLVKRVNEGRIEITGMYFNYGEIVDEAGLAAQLLPLIDIKNAGMQPHTLMQDDVNGIGWALVDYAQHTGIHNVLMGQHGHRARVPFDYPTAFWWESPAGNRLLAYRSEHYMHGNVLGLTTGVLDTFKDGLVNYLDELGQTDYPMDVTAFQFSGYVTDNAPPSVVACEMVKQWNEKYEWPRVKLAVAGEFFKYLEDNHAGDLPVFRVAWPDWWADGFGSAMRETQSVRATQEEMIANTGLLSMARFMGAPLSPEIVDDIQRIREPLLFYDEHTFGAAESISDPLGENSMVQWAEKSSYAWEAAMHSRLLTEKAMGWLQSFIPKTDNPSLVVFNTLNWKRSGLVTVFIDHEIIPPGKEFSIVDSRNRVVPAQAVESRSDGTYWGLWVSDIPPMGYSTFEIITGDGPRTSVMETKNTDSFSNGYYTVEIDPDKGYITGIYDKELKEYITDQQDTILTGQLIYEQLANRHQLERFTSLKKDTVFVPLNGTRRSPDRWQLISVTDGPVWKSLTMHADLPGCADQRGVNMEIRLYTMEKRIGFLYQMYKQNITDPEALYVSFPFHLEDGEVVFEAQGGVVVPGVNQLEGTSSDWNTIQNFAAVRNDHSQVVFESGDVPLAQFGEINTGHFYYQHQPEKEHIYSWVLNNYWTTNFRASQEGELSWQYSLTSAADNSNGFATRFSMGSRIPLLTRVFPAGHTRNALQDASWIHIPAPNLVLIAARPSLDHTGVILQLRETDGKPADLDLNALLTHGNTGTVSRVNVLEEEISSLKGSLRIGPCEVVFLKVQW